MKHARIVSRFVVVTGTSFLLAHSQTAVAGEDTTYKQQALHLIGESKEVFLRKGICSGKASDCVRKELVLGTIGNLDQAANAFYREFATSITLTAEAQALSDIVGAGKVRDLWEAASLLAALAKSRRRRDGATMPANEAKWQIAA